MKIIDYAQVVEDGAYTNVDAYIVDLMAGIRVVGIFLTVEELLINRKLSIIPRDCRRVYLVADSYWEISWENSTSAARGRDHLPSWSQQKLRSKAPTPSNMKMKMSLCLSNFSSTGLLTVKGKQ